MPTWIRSGGGNILRSSMNIFARPWRITSSCSTNIPITFLTVAVGAAEVENVMGIFVEQLEVILHGLANIFIDDLRIFPPPFRIQVGITDHVKGRLPG